MASKSLLLDGITAIVTGSSSGIGRSISLAFAEEGAAHVVCVDLDPNPSKWVVEKWLGRSKTEPDDQRSADDLVPTHELLCRRYGETKATFLPCDVSIETTEEESGAQDGKLLGMEDVVKKAVGITGRLDVMVNSAGIGLFGVPAHETPLDMWNKSISVNSTGAFLGMKHSLAQFLKQDPDKYKFRGNIINIAGIGASVGIRGCGVYCASKGATVAFSRSVAIDYAKHGIRCNVLCPSYVQTPMLEPVLETEEGLQEYLDTWIPMERIGLPRDVAGAAIWLANGRDSGYITGISLDVDGGFTAR